MTSLTLNCNAAVLLYLLVTWYWFLSDDIVSYQNSPTALIPFLNFENCAWDKILKLIFSPFNPSAYPAVYETEAQHFHIAYPAVSETDFAHPWKCSYNFGKTWPNTIKQHSLNFWNFTLSSCIQFKSFCITTKSQPVSKCTVSFTEGKIKWYFAGIKSKRKG